MKAYILITIDTGQAIQAVDILRRMDGVTEATMTFGPYDAIAVVIADDISQLSRIVANDIHPVPGVIETLTCLAID